MENFSDVQARIANKLRRDAKCIAFVIGLSGFGCAVVLINVWKG